MSSSEEKNKKAGLVISIVLHSILLILFAIFGLTYWDPPLEQGGLTINFGTTDIGMATPDENPPSEQSEEQVVEENIPEPEPAETIEEEIVTQDVDEAPSINEKKEEKKEIEPVKKEPEPKPNKMLDLADRMKKKNAQQGGGDGNKDEAGDQGKTNGDKNSKNYDGAGGNGNSSFDLAGRSRKFIPRIKDDSQEEGTVVVDIIVDKYGKVIRAAPGARGSNTTSPILYKKAREAALKTKFNINLDAAEEQKGTMTFIFILN